ncbi:MAG: hypothetical protein KGL39_47580 [Patescibacteria group bacterium]|nr:hypothetical protein [Patescibacteria group bacterium]
MPNPYTIIDLPDGEYRLVENAGTPDEAFLLRSRPADDLLDIARAIYAHLGGAFQVMTDPDDDDALFLLQTQLRHEFQDSHTRLLADNAQLAHDLEVTKDQLVRLAKLLLPGPTTKYVDVRDGDVMATGYSPVVLNEILAELNGQQRLLKAV